jgi:hypothetical protein
VTAGDWACAATRAGVYGMRSDTPVWAASARYSAMATEAAVTKVTLSEAVHGGESG